MCKCLLFAKNFFRYVSTSLDAIKKKKVLRVRRNANLMMHVGTLHHFVQHLQDEDENFLLHDNNDIFNLSEHYVRFEFFTRLKTLLLGIWKRNAVFKSNILSLIVLRTNEYAFNFFCYQKSTNKAVVKSVWLSLQITILFRIFQRIFRHQRIIPHRNYIEKRIIARRSQLKRPFQMCDISNGSLVGGNAAAHFNYDYDNFLIHI